MLTRQQVLYGLERVELRSTSIFDSCPLKSRTGRQDECSGFSAMYRTPDGTCNNFKVPGEQAAIEILAPSGAQSVTMSIYLSVRLSDTKCFLSIF